MRKFSILLPSEISNYALDVSSELSNIENDMVPTISRYHILQISSLAEQSLKKLRDYVIPSKEDEVLSHINKYFIRKNNREPLYPRRNSSYDLMSDFEIKRSEKLNLKKLAEIATLKIFEESDNLEELEKRLGNMRNKAAHEISPNFSISKKDLEEMYDFVLLLLFYTYQHMKSYFVIKKEEIEIDSISFYEEIFVSDKLVKNINKRILYRPFDITSTGNDEVLVINFSVNDLSKFEIDKLLRKCVNKTDIGNIINSNSYDYKLLCQEKSNKVNSIINNLSTIQDNQTRENSLIGDLVDILHQTDILNGHFDISNNGNVKFI